MPPVTSHTPVFRARKHSEKTRKKEAPPYAVSEINAYIAIRDDLLSEAEQSRAKAKLDSVSIANDFVQGCLKPARTPYEAQCLPQADAARERKRCEFVRSRIAELRARAL